MPARRLFGGVLGICDFKRKTLRQNHRPLTEPKGPGFSGQNINMTTLTLDNLVKSYDGRRVVNSVSLSSENSSVVGRLGPNGAGKTTTFYMTIGMIKPDKGQVSLGNEDITACPMYVRARKGVGYLPQETSIFRKLTVKQNIMAILEILPIDKSSRDDRANMLLDELGIKHLAGQKANLLSGGERRRLEISRALATNPSFILLDEPFCRNRSFGRHRHQKYYPTFEKTRYRCSYI